jgi:hypothetical protein
MEIKYYLIGFTNEETAREFMELIKKKLGEGVNSWVSSETLNEMQSMIRELQEE